MSRKPTLDPEKVKQANLMIIEGKSWPEVARFLERSIITAKKYCKSKEVAA